MEKKTIIVGGTEFPVETTINGEEVTLLNSVEEGDLFREFSSLYTGPFHAEDFDGNVIPMAYTSKLVIEANGNKHQVLARRKSCDNKDGFVVDSKGTVVVQTRTWKEASAISVMLNRMPRSMMEGYRIGISPGHGITKIKKDDLTFWAVYIPKLSHEDMKTVVGRSFVMPMWNRYELPGLSRNPMTALRFKGHGSANAFCEFIKNELLTIDSVKTRLDRQSAKMVKNGVDVPDWNSLTPVMIKYAYNVIG